MRNAKIVCTLGPASDDESTIRGLTDAGMSVARINASHGSRDERAALVDRIQQVRETVESPLATMLDLQGPEIRTADIATPKSLAAGDDIRFVQGETDSDDVVGLSLELSGVAPGDRILIDDGRIETTVTSIDGGVVHARVETGGTLRSRRGVNVPGVDVDMPFVSAADRAELRLAATHDVDFVAASFVRDGADVLAVNAVLETEGSGRPIIAKIERAAAVENLASIIDAAYGVMVARGDLGVECELEDVPLIQKRIIRRCQHAGVPVITATEMLDSMVHQPRPTRAEASDVANAVLDGTDAVMLSGETAVGDHPIVVVETMDRIVREVEASDEYDELREQRVPGAEASSTDALARAARYLARDVGASAVIVASESGYTALKTAKFRPSVPIVAAAPNEQVRRQLALSWGIIPQFAELGDAGVAGVIENAVQAAMASGTVDSGNTVVVLSGMMTELDRSTTNTLKVHVAAERVGTGRGVVTGQVVGPLNRSSTGDLSAVPEGAILSLSAAFDGEFAGDVSKLGGIVHEVPGMTGYPAMIARELGIPMASGVAVHASVEDGTTVTLDGERGVVYRGDVTTRPEE